MNTETLQLWFAYPDDVLAEGAEEACIELLSEDERARWQAFKFDRLRREYLATRALERTALSHNHDIAPAAWRFTLNGYGKPAVEPGFGLNFNLSNCHHLVACLIARGAEVGVDVEAFKRAREIAEVAPRVFSPTELAQLDALQDSERSDRCLSLWTLKEAYIKARGMGFSLPLKRISFVFWEAKGIRLELDRSLNDEADRWRFCLLDHADHRIALVAERAPDPELEIWESRPVPGSPTRLSNRSPRWFPHS
jgi:4'-phosphopantetheinyl transferase